MATIPTNPKSFTLAFCEHFKFPYRNMMEPVDLATCEGTPYAVATFMLTADDIAAIGQIMKGESL